MVGIGSKEWIVQVLGRHSFAANIENIPLPKETVGRVRAVLIEMLTNDNKEDEDIEDDDKEDDDKEDDD